MRNHVDLPTLSALQDEWQQHPPVHHLVAAYLSYDPPHAADSPKHDDAMQQLMSMMPTTPNAPKLDTGLWDSFVQPATSQEPAHG